MSVDVLKQAWAAWVPFESSPSAEVKQALDLVRREPSAAADDFFEQTVEAYHEDDDGFWIGEAIRYAQVACDRARAQRWLEAILLDVEKYGSLGAEQAKAASILGVIAAYPNAALARTMEGRGTPVTDGEVVYQRFLRASAYGGYIMTATDFETGLNAGRAMNASGQEPSVELAEQFLRDHRTAL